MSNTHKLIHKSKWDNIDITIWEKLDCYGIGIDHYEFQSTQDGERVPSKVSETGYRSLRTQLWRGQQTNKNRKIVREDVIEEVLKILGDEPKQRSLI